MTGSHEVRGSIPLSSTNEKDKRSRFLNRLRFFFRDRPAEALNASPARRMTLFSLFFQFNQRGSPTSRFGGGIPITLDLRISLQ